MNAPFAWLPVGTVAPDALADARLQLHWALQLPASLAGVVPEQPHYAHHSFAWWPALHMWVSHPLPGTPPVRAALRPADLSLHVLQGEASLNDLALHGQTHAEALAWLRNALQPFLTGNAAPLTPPDHEMPAHPVGQGAAYNAEDAPAFEEMRRWYANGHGALTVLRPGLQHPSPIQCWPHHFDIAVLSTLDPAADPEQARSIGVGLSPGDGNYPEPYWHVYPWPYPDAAALPAWTGPGHWHTQGWIGAVYPAHTLPEAGPAQQETVLAFLQAGLTACRALLA